MENPHVEHVFSEFTSRYKYQLCVIKKSKVQILFFFFFWEWKAVFIYFGHNA